MTQKKQFIQVPDRCHLSKTSDQKLTFAFRTPPSPLVKLRLFWRHPLPPSPFTDVRTVSRKNVRNTKYPTFQTFTHNIIRPQKQKIFCFSDLNILRLWTSCLCHTPSPPLSAVVHICSPPPPISPDVFHGWPHTSSSLARRPCMFGILFMDDAPTIWNTLGLLLRSSFSLSTLWKREEGKHYGLYFLSM